MDYSAHELIYDLSGDCCNASEAVSDLLWRANNLLTLALRLLCKLKDEGHACDFTNAPDLPVGRLMSLARKIETFYYQKKTA